MADIVSAVKRSQMMAGIKGKNTKPELIVRSLLHNLGFRFRLHDKKLPGKPDIVLPRYKVVVMIHGCFWHGHNCSLFKLPSTNKEFWLTKISSNIARDQRDIENLNLAGWRILTIWECSLRGKTKYSIHDFAAICKTWITHGISNFEIKGL
jgi:DNA mismatch endonuclease (patch repair protein)